MVQAPPGRSAPPRPTPQRRAHKRKHENDSGYKRRVAQRFQLCADVTDAFHVVQGATQRHLLKYKQTQAHVAALERLQAATELTARFETLCAAELDGVEMDKLTGLHKKLDRMLDRLSSSKPPEHKLEKLCRRLPRVMNKAEKLIQEQQKLLEEQDKLPGAHQWLPDTLWKLYDDAVAAAKEDAKMEPLKTAMHGVMATMRQQDPFFYLQVLYQPPPPHADGEFEIAASEKLNAICASMTPFFRDLQRRAYALKNRTDSYVRIHYGWNQLRVTMTYVRRAARHFHFLILHLYAVAMGCDAPNTHAGIISEKAAKGFHSADAELRSQLRIHESVVNSPDNLIKETYEWSPELLVFIDEWRRHRDCQNLSFGFRSATNMRHFLPKFSDDTTTKYGKPKYDVLSRIAGYLQYVDLVWRESCLGTSKFTSMRIEDVGKLESKIKENLGFVIGSVYTMMLARWLDRRGRPEQWWASLELCQDTSASATASADDTAKAIEDNQIEGDTDGDGTTNPADSAATSDANEDNPAEDVEAGPTPIPEKLDAPDARIPRPSKFRAPSTVILPVRPELKRGKVNRNSGNASSPSVELSGLVPQAMVNDDPIRLRDVTAWTDQEIDTFSHESERIRNVRAAMLTLCKQMTKSKVAIETANQVTARPDFGELIPNDWRATCLVNRALSLTSTAAALAEEVAFHDAAKMLTKRPSLRSQEKNTAPGKSCEKPAVQEVSTNADDELLEMIRIDNKNVSQMVSQYDGEQTSEWSQRLQSVGRASLQLLRLISQGVSVDES